ncbi:MAG: two-component system, NtrC family, nitrogen regulation sensor histidine kinase NtrY [Acidobacteriota bacterium]|nr:two-component system, NtrC family, nitrogen regulation sensor histidine kinase NtrY [Acidobacteriota bacterium]
MSWRSTAATLGGMVLAAAAVLFLFERQLSTAWFRLGLQPEVISALEGSQEDRRQLARLDPQRETEYRGRFEEDQALLNRLRILEHNRKEILRRYEMILLMVVGGVLAAAGGAHLVHQGRRERRIDRLREALVQLSAGQENVDIGDRGKDTIGRIAAMIEETSRVMARDRRRLAALQNLSMWQETARRHAHEMKTPLTAARLELTRLREMVSGESKQAVDSLGEELDRLGRFTREFTSFARLPKPRLEVHDLGAVVSEFASTFDLAWPSLALRVSAPGQFLATVDRELLRQTLVNLCDNSAHAQARTVTFQVGRNGTGIYVEVADDGPGIAPEIRGRVFEPYVTTRKVGEGMGLGLAISKKILLDHGGDLELVETSAAGTKFRITLQQGEP